MIVVLSVLAIIKCNFLVAFCYVVWYNYTINNQEKSSTGGIVNIKKGYRKLAEGEIIKSGDEFLHRNQWIDVGQSDSTGKVYVEGMKIIRRKGDDGDAPVGAQPIPNALGVMPNFEKYNLSANCAFLPEILSNAARLGICDEVNGNIQRDGKSIARLLCSSWLIGHQRAIKAAYSAGRWSAGLAR